MPLVSVIITTYNRAALLPDCLRGVLAQTWTDFEVIVVDDGSADETEEVIQPFLNRIRYVRQENAERGAARNHGLRLATGRYAAFLDSDDLWLPGKLEAEVKRFRGFPGAGLVYSDALYIDAEGRALGRVGRRSPHEGDVLKTIVQDNFVSVGAHLLDRERFVAAGGFNPDRTLSGSEDWEAWVRLAAHAPFAHARNVGLLYRLHDGGSVAHPEAMERAMLRACDLIYQNPDLAPRIAGLRPRTEAYLHRVLASYYYAVGRGSDARCQLQLARGAHPPVVFDPVYLAILARLLAGPRVATGLRQLRQSFFQQSHRTIASRVGSNPSAPASISPCEVER